MATASYLQDADLAEYITITPAVAQRASFLVNRYLNRPEGLAWKQGAYGPLYMLSAEPTFQINATAQGSVLPNGFVQVPIDTRPLEDWLNKPVIVGYGGGAEQLATVMGVVSARVSGATYLNSLILSPLSVLNGPADVIAFGMTSSDHIRLPDKRPVGRLTKLPVARLLGAEGRYGFGRRSTQYTSEADAYNMLSALQTLGGAPIWSLIDPYSMSLDHRTGEIWVPAGLFQSYFNEVNVYYLAGWEQSSVPDTFKFAVAQVAMNIAAAEDFAIPNVTRVSAGTSSITRAIASYFDIDTKSILSPYRAVSVA